MEKLYISDWFKLPPKKQLNKMRVIKLQKRGTGRKRGKSCKKTKK